MCLYKKINQKYARFLFLFRQFYLARYRCTLVITRKTGFFYDTYPYPTGYTGYSLDFACIKLFVCYIEPLIMLIIVSINNQSTFRRVNTISKSIIQIYKLDEFFSPMYSYLIKNDLCVNTRSATYQCLNSREICYL